MMFNLFKKAEGKGGVTPPGEETSPVVREKSKKPGQSPVFRARVLKAKLEVIEAIKYADKQRALDSLTVLSTLAAETIYEHDLHAMFIINNTIDEINQHIDAKLKVTGEPNDLIEDIDETRMYLMIRLAMLPVISMMSALQHFSDTGMDKVNGDIDTRIGQIRAFVMEHERNPK
ncbi:MAG TPA: hypothetical protein VMC84_03960 [Methanocella sp.]|uniref:hypothetical protein n=1 Tax=Methanocella sp. TaxID=2052833 RepID=UPI002D15A7FF|nr:hypothetical protein [Methanocella sp.]HTY90309.1 hypothetical protein [Methanocella sp.]